MRTKKVQSNNRNKSFNSYNNKSHKSHKSHKSKKCKCGVKLPFLKWGGDNIPNGPKQTNNINLSEKIQNLFSATKDKLTGDFNDLTSASKNAIKNVTDSTKSVMTDTGNQIKKHTDVVLNKTKSDEKNNSDKASDYFNNIFENAKKSLHDVTKPKSTNKDGAIIAKPVSSATTSTSSLSKSSGSNGSISTTDKYNSNVIKKYRNLLNNNNKQGGRRRSSKRQITVNTKKTKRRQMYKYNYKGGSNSLGDDGPVGIEKSSVAFTASPISNIKAVGPSADQMYSQTPYPVWRLGH